MIRSARMKARTPPNEMPPFHSTAASGTLPIEHTNDSTATSGPISTPQIVESAPWCSRNSDCQKLSGTQAASAPAMRSPPKMSRATAAQSMTKFAAVESTPSRESRRSRIRPRLCTDISISACPSIRPRRPRWACSRASPTSRAVSSRRNRTATTTIISGPATNSAAVNCHPSTSAITTPSSITRLVEAISNAIAATKFAPFRKSERASATAA